jgi:hypothetical protein
MNTDQTEPANWLLGTYCVSHHERELRAIRIPGEQTLHIIDVLATPRSEDGDLDERQVEDRVRGVDEARAIATDYINLAEQLGLPPMPDVSW